MIARLRGVLVAVDAAGLVVEVGGVGYRVLVPAGAFSQRLGDEVVVHTHLAVREDALTLFGFADSGALVLFERLLGVNGVGPKLALSALSTLGAGGLRDAVVTEDVKTLVRVPGLGRKTAQRLILELGGTLVADADDHGDGAAATASMSVTTGDDPQTDVRLALGALGYDPAEIARALRAVGDGVADDRDGLLRRALQTLGERR